MRRDLYAEVSARIVAKLEAGAACVYRKPYRVDDVTESPKLGE
jgi:antirestriction protein ArdC